MQLMLLGVLAVCYIRVISGQSYVSRVRPVTAASTPGATCVKAAPNKPALAAEELSSILQLASILSKAQSPPPPPPPPPTATPNNALNSGGIIDKLIDALIITATQKNQPAPSSGRLIDVDVLKSLLNLQGSSSQLSSPAQATAALTTSSPTPSTVPLSTTTASTPASSATQVEDTSSVVGDNPTASLSTLSNALRTILES